MTTYNTLAAQMRQAKTLPEFHAYAVALVQHLKQTSNSKGSPHEPQTPSTTPSQARPA
jgi:hypothetical protein